MSTTVPSEYIMDPTEEPSSSADGSRLLSLMRNPSSLFCDYPSQDGNYENNYAKFRAEVIFDYLLSLKPELARKVSLPAILTPNQFLDVKGRYVISDDKPEGARTVRTHLSNGETASTFHGLWWAPFKKEDCFQGPYKLSDVTKFCAVAMYQGKPIIAELGVWERFVSYGVLPAFVF